MSTFKGRRVLASLALAVSIGVAADSSVLAQPAPGPAPGQPQQRPRINIRPQMDPNAGRPPAPAPAPAKPAAEKQAESVEKECDGNFDHPRPINWYQGIIGVNNEKATKGSGVEKLLYRYHNDKDDCDERNQDPPFLAQVFNFAILAFLIVYFGKKPIMNGLAERKKSIMGDVEAAEALRADAEKRLKTYERQFSNISDHRAELEDEYRAQSQNEQKRILAEADEKRARMIKDAELRVEQELRQAQGELLREAIDQAVVAAEELLKKKIGPQDLDRLADDYLTGLGGALTKGTTTQKLGGAA